MKRLFPILLSCVLLMISMNACEPMLDLIPTSTAAAGTTGNSSHPGTTSHAVFLDQRECSDPSQNTGMTRVYYAGGYKLVVDPNVKSSDPYSYPSGFPPDGMEQDFFGPSGAGFMMQVCPLKVTPPSAQCVTVRETFGLCNVGGAKNNCQPPANGCGKNPVTGGPTRWNPATCSCQ